MVQESSYEAPAIVELKEDLPPTSANFSSNKRNTPAEGVPRGSETGIVKTRSGSDEEPK